ncbi:hypothetical protein [Nitrososphaera sp.]|uniref:hypothetical protein n=1 Tax=Nitrososphaera sp. TaxID=1971748 RepID=UPI00307D7DAF
MKYYEPKLSLYHPDKLLTLSAHPLWMLFLSAMPIISLTLFIPLLSQHDAYAHFFGETVDVDGRFQVVFAPYPSTPAPGDNSTRLNFSVLENGSNIYNIHAAVVITDKQSGDLVDQVSYRPYEFSDITVPYTFQKAGSYVVTLQTRITGDEKYQSNPLVTSFDLSVASQNLLMLTDRVTLAILIVTAIIGAGGAVMLYIRKKL